VRARLPIAIAAVQAIALVLLARAHPFGTYATETDFYRWYGPDAVRLAHGVFPGNPFQNPGYPALLALVGPLAGGDLFLAGKALSVVAAVAAGGLTYVLVARGFGRAAGAGAQALLVVSGPMLELGISVTTDMVFLALLLATLVVLTGDGPRPRARAAVAGLLAGLTYLVRVPGVVLVPAGLVGVLALDRARPRLARAAIFVGVTVAVVLPWLIWNARERGSPFYSQNYLNIAAAYHPEIGGQWAIDLIAQKIHSFRDVLDWQLVRRYPVHVLGALRLSATTDLVSRWVAATAVVGAGLVVLERRWRAPALLLIAAALYLAMVALVHWETRYYLLIAVVYAALAAFAAVRLVERLRPAWALVSVAWLVGLVAVALAQSSWIVSRFLAHHPTELLAACDRLRADGVSGARIMARKPHLAALCGDQAVGYPNRASLVELRAAVDAGAADYLYFSTAEWPPGSGTVPLDDPRSAPPWLRPVWRASGAALYRVVR
jgi:hypothetical protein